jgi:Na+-driven multidrug efflux pump
MKVLTISSFISAGVRAIVTVIAVTQLGMLGVIVGWISDWVVEFAFILIVYLTNKWKTSNYIALENECLQQTEILSEG